MSQSESGEFRMSSAQIAAAHVERLMELERRESPVAVARRIVARRVGMSASAVEDVQRGRVKRLCADVYRKIQTALIEALTQEIAVATHELEMARQCGLDPSEVEMARLKAAVSDAQKIIEGEV